MADGNDNADAFVDLLEESADALGVDPYTHLSEVWDPGLFRTHRMEETWMPWRRRFDGLAVGDAAPPIDGFLATRAPVDWPRMPEGQVLVQLQPFHRAMGSVALLLPAGKTAPDGAFVEVRGGVRGAVTYHGEAGYHSMPVLVADGVTPKRLFDLYDRAPQRLRDARYVPHLLQDWLRSSKETARHLSRALVGSPAFEVRAPGIDARLAIDEAEKSDLDRLGKLTEAFFPEPYRRRVGADGRITRGGVHAAEVTYAALEPDRGYRRIGQKRQAVEDNTVVLGDPGTEPFTRFLDGINYPLLLDRDDVSVPSALHAGEVDDVSAALLLRRLLRPNFTTGKEAERALRVASENVALTLEADLPDAGGYVRTAEHLGVPQRVRAGVVQSAMAHARLESRARVTVRDVEAAAAAFSDAAVQLFRDPYAVRLAKRARDMEESRKNVERRDALEGVLAGSDAGLSLPELWDAPVVQSLFRDPAHLQAYVEKLHAAGRVISTGGRYRWV